MQKVCWESVFYFILAGKKMTVCKEEEVAKEVYHPPPQNPMTPPIKYQIFHIYIHQSLCSRHLNVFPLVS